jgi:hypothetical protein
VPDAVHKREGVLRQSLPPVTRRLFFVDRAFVRLGFSFICWYSIMDEGVLSKLSRYHQNKKFTEIVFSKVDLFVNQLSFLTSPVLTFLFLWCKKLM